MQAMKARLMTLSAGRSLTFTRTVGEDPFARNNYTPKSELVAEPYRHHDYRAIVMSPIEAPKVAQPTVGKILPAYLTKEVTQADLQKDAEARLRVLGMPHFFRFLEDCQLAQYVHEIAVPQWIPFTNNVADSLVQGCSQLLLPAYARGLSAQPTLPRAILFFKKPCCRLHDRERRIFRYFISTYALPNPLHRPSQT